MQANADFDFDVGHVPHLEGADTVQDVQTHVGHLARMPVPVPVGDP